MTGFEHRPLLEVTGLRVAYNKVEAVHDVSLAVGRGQIVTVIGPNGAGKTTLLSALMGLLPASGGSIRFDGHMVGALETEVLAGMGLALVPESRALFGTMPVLDNLLLGAYSRRRRDRAEIRDDLEQIFAIFPRLKERRRQRANTLSGGERQMLAIGRALMARPQLLLLDEPSLGLAPLVVKEIFATIAELRQEGVSILIVEQNARAALQLADYGYVLENGECVLQGASAGLATDPRVIESYLGAAAH